MLLGGVLGLCAILLGIASVRHARGLLRVIGPVMGATAATVLLGVVAHPALRDRMDPEVAVTEGHVLQQTSVGRNPGQAVLHFERVRVMTRGTGSSSHAAIDRRSVYRAYYLPHTRRLLSIERVTPRAP